MYTYILLNLSKQFINLFETGIWLNDRLIRETNSPSNSGGPIKDKELGQHMVLSLFSLIYTCLSFI